MFKNRFGGILLMLILVVQIGALTIEVQTPEIQNRSFVNDLPKNDTPGEPAIPYVPVRYLLPMGEKVTSVEVILSGKEELPGRFDIDYARHPRPISNSEITSEELDLSVYELDQLFPTRDYEYLSSERLRGHDIAILNIYPYRYNPVTRTVHWYRQAEVRIQTESDSDLYEEQNRFLLTNRRTLDRISMLVNNPENINSYSKHPVQYRSILPDPSEPYKMVIITGEQFTDTFSDYIDWKASEGIPTGIFEIEEILSSYDGVDDAEKMRNFIIDAYETYSGTDTPLEYVILGGDDTVVPKRGVYGEVGNYVDYAMPSDIYFSNLDGCWDANGNGIYGEVDDEVDMFAEVAISRIPGETETEFENVLYKNQHYSTNTNIGDGIAYMFGENLDNEPTWGGDYKDEISPLIDPDFHISTLYERDGTFSNVAVREAVNEGLSIINHLGHANESIVFGQTRWSAHQMNNTSYGFAYTQGCYPAAFDFATSGEENAVGEHLVTASGGLYAFIGNTRYGWYMPGSTQGPSQAYDITFFEALFDHNIRRIGDTKVHSREALVNQALSSGVMRWIYFQLVLFGEPTTEIKDAPEGFPYLDVVSVEYDDSMGDGDGIPNPGETIELFLTLENLEGWSDASDISAILSFTDENMDVVQDSVYAPFIPSGNSFQFPSFIINIPENANYETYHYTIEVTAPAAEGHFFEKAFNFGMGVSLFYQNWPWYNSIAIRSNPAILDLNNDGQKEIVFSDAMGSIQILDIQKNHQTNSPIQMNEDIFGSYAIADMTGNSELDFVFASRNGTVYVLDRFGEIQIYIETDHIFMLTPVVADITGDGHPEIIVYSVDSQLYAFDRFGNVLQGFPTELSFVTGAELAVADIDESGTADIIVATLDGNIHAIDGTGASLNGFPASFNSLIRSAPIVLDNRQIVVGTEDNQVHIIDQTGELVLSKELNHKVAGSPIAADFDDDGELDIALVTKNGTVYLFKQNGDDFPGFPVMNNKNVNTPPLAVDIDNDGFPEVLFLSTDNTLYGFKIDGSGLPFTPVPVNTSGSNPASIEDIDNNGTFEFVSGTPTGAYVLDIKVPKGEKIPWNVYRGNYQRTGFYGDNELFTEANDFVLPAQVAILHQNYPNPFNPNTKIAFSLPEAADVTLNIYNIKGQKVRTLIREEHFSKGNHILEWDGRDRRNRELGTGIYLYELKADNTRIDVRKCLLLK